MIDSGAVTTTLKSSRGRVTVRFISKRPGRLTFRCVLECDLSYRLAREGDVVEVQSEAVNGHAGPYWSLARSLLKDFAMVIDGGSPATPADLLTGREREVLDLVAGGATTTQAAQRLNLSPNTVNCHVRHILRKLRVHSRVEAAAHALHADFGPADAKMPVWATGDLSSLLGV